MKTYRAKWIDGHTKGRVRHFILLDVQGVGKGDVLVVLYTDNALIDYIKREEVDIVTNRFFYADIPELQLKLEIEAVESLYKVWSLEVKKQEPDLDYLDRKINERFKLKRGRADLNHETVEIIKTGFVKDVKRHLKEEEVNGKNK